MSEVKTNKQPSFFPRANRWTMSGIWNTALVSKAERPATPRERLWASELGKAPIEIFLKMRGVEASNPPNPRSKRKFEAGNMFEWIVGLVLKRAGILKEAQQWVGHQYPGLLEVSGKSDFKAGGIPDYEHWKDKLDALELPEFFMKATEQIIEHFAKQYPEGLADMYLEIKSCSSFMMDAMERTGNASKPHRLQLFHYLKANNFPRGMVVYICRDDLRMFEVFVENPSDVEQEYKDAIQVFSTFHEVNKKLKTEEFLIAPDSSDVKKWIYNPNNITTLPPLEKNIVWDKDLKKFSRNWGVEYSNYLTMLYGYETQLEFEEATMPVVTRWNAALARVRKINLREQWLLQASANEADVMQDKIEGTRKKGKQYIQEGDEKIYLPDEIQGSVKLSPMNLDSIEAMKWEGFKVEELALEFAGEKESEEEISA